MRNWGSLRQNSQKRSEMPSNTNQYFKIGTSTRPLVLLLAALISISAIDAGSRDRVPPEVVVEPCESSDPERDVVVRARISDISGVGTVTVWARGEMDSGFEGFPMRSSGAGEWTGRVPFWPARGMSVAYFVEATDIMGNGPRRAGSPETPFVVHLDREPTLVAEHVARFGWNWINWILLGGTLLGIVFLGFVAYSFRNRRPRTAELDFWSNLLSPLSDKTGIELSKRMDRLCECYHDHPTLGRIRIQREEALLWLGTIRNCEPGRLRLMRQLNRNGGRVTAGTDQPLRTATHREVAEDTFWLQLLVPLLGLSRAEIAEGIRDLSSRPHVHPTRGIVTLDQRTLRGRLRSVQRANSAEIAALWNSANAAKGRTHERAQDEPGLGKSAGVTFPEVLVVMAILGLVAGAATLYLKPLEAPVVTAAHLVEALVKQTRAKSMSTTSSYRVRPFTAEELVVEYAASCSAVAWTLDPRMDLDLPRGVTMSESGWSVCFNSRGTASDNVTLVLDHADYRAQKLEILMGGAVRWSAQ